MKSISIPYYNFIGHVALNTPKLEELLAYYTDALGFAITERSGDGAVYLHSDVDHHSIILYPATEPGIHHFALQLRGDLSLQAAESQLRDQGLKVKSMTDAQPGIPEMLEFTDPEGYIVQLYQNIALAPAAQAGTQEKFLKVQKLGHVALRVQNPQATAEFYQSMLGFRVSDWMSDHFVFMRCNSDHHSLNFIRSPHHSMLHIAFQLDDWASIGNFGDHLAKQHIPFIWGPGRHGAGHNIFTYHLDPDSNVVELFTQMDLMLNEDLGYFDPRPWHEDVPQRPKVWAPDPKAANMWGAGPPELLSH